MSAEDLELIAEFVVESNEHLADVENQLLAIESQGSEVDLELVNTVFRAVHSVKGAAGFLQLHGINRLAHSLENVLNKIRSQELSPTAASTDLMLKSADMLRTLINDVAGSNDYDTSALVKLLDAVADGKELSSDEVTSAKAATPAAAPAPPAEPAPVAPPVEVAAIPSAATPETAPAPLESTQVAEAAVSESLPVEALPTETTAAVANAEAKSPAKSGRQAATPQHIDSSIRVSVQVLDRLMNLAGELVLSRNQLLQAVAAPERNGLDAAAAGLDHVTSELQEAIMQTRMQPIGNVFGKFPRIVRDLSAKLSKECSIEIEGKEVEVDKTIIEAIGDPLTHLIRNSVDHGVESPHVRTKAGKNPQGMIFLRAYHKAGKVCIEIVDDGAGINPDKLKAKAVEKGVLSPEQAAQMSDREAVRLIFHPGFSTAEKVSDVSGRGVGMDVVRTNIERLGGIVDVESVIGAGTTIRVTLPLTLAIIPSMIIRCNDQRFAIPQANIVELVRLRPGEAETRIGSVKSGEVLRLRGNLLPLVRLCRVLNLETEDEEQDYSDRPINVIVVETGQVRYGLVVDGISDSEEIVVKP
ncbi:MAG: chemotaxis protein CheA, partial [Planctomycetales bacterium]|nr:chemotaxis protein CheA [Planctomycetales bacterium]